MDAELKPYSHGYALPHKGSAGKVETNEWHRNDDKRKGRMARNENRVAQVRPYMKNSIGSVPFEPFG